jgi:dUTP pyrophosphatase
MKLLFKRLIDHKLPIPSRGSEFAVGLDLQAAESHVIEPGKRQLIKTGFAVQIPDGHYGRIAPRSGLAYKHGIDVLAGVIDIDYRGDVGVILINTCENSFTVNMGDKIAQLIIEACSYPETSEVDALPDTVRGEGGYGSTGK